MPDINPKDVMKLRNETGLPMMACKSALEKANGDFEAAKEILRKELKGKMESRADRPAGDGRIAVCVNHAAGVASIVEIRAETDFTAKNEKFMNVCSACAQLALEAHAGSVPVSRCV